MVTMCVWTAIGSARKHFIQTGFFPGPNTHSTDGQPRAGELAYGILYDALLGRPSRGKKDALIGPIRSADCGMKHPRSLAQACWRIEQHMTTSLHYLLNIGSQLFLTRAPGAVGKGYGRISSTSRPTQLRLMALNHPFQLLY